MWKCVAVGLTAALLGMLLRKNSGELAGTCLIYWNDEDEESHWDISYNLGRKYWGKWSAAKKVKVK